MSYNVSPVYGTNGIEKRDRIKRMVNITNRYPTHNLMQHIAISNAIIYVYYEANTQLPSEIENKVIVELSKLNHFKLLPYYFKERIADL